MYACVPDIIKILLARLAIASVFYVSMRVINASDLPNSGRYAKPHKPSVNVLE